MSGENETLAKTSKPKFSVFLLILLWKTTTTSLRKTKFIEQKLSKKRTM